MSPGGLSPRDRPVPSEMLSVRNRTKRKPRVNPEHRWTFPPPGLLRFDRSIKLYSMFCRVPNRVVQRREIFWQNQSAVRLADQYHSTTA